MRVALDGSRRLPRQLGLPRLSRQMIRAAATTTHRLNCAQLVHRRSARWDHESKLLLANSRAISLSSSKPFRG